MSNGTPRPCRPWYVLSIRATTCLTMDDPVSPQFPNPCVVAHDLQGAARTYATATWWTLRCPHLCPECINCTIVSIFLLICTATSTYKGSSRDTYHENGRFETMVHRSSFQRSTECFNGPDGSTLEPVQASDHSRNLNSQVSHPIATSSSSAVFPMASSPDGPRPRLGNQPTQGCYFAAGTSRFIGPASAGLGLHVYH